MSAGPRSIALLSSLAVLACGGDDDGGPSGSTPDAATAPADAAPPAVTCEEATLEISLAALPDVASVSEATCGDYVVSPARCFSIEMNQAIDHADEASPTFPQHLFLVHRGCDRPTLVADWGYSHEFFYDIELSLLYQSNALWIEHRYQGLSVPAAADWDWSQLTIENGARDMHQVIAAFRQLYDGRWVSTGASKGGITATYHKYFFPDDVDGAIPYVAPASRARIDPEYQTFLADALPAGCGNRLRDTQVAALTTRRNMMLSRLTDYVGAGAESEWLELLTTHLDWSFWQAWGVTYCNQVPRDTATNAQFWRFYLDFSYLAWAAPAADPMMSDGALYYEWLTEQGFALQVNDRVAPLLEHSSARATMEDNFRDTFPTIDLPAYDGSVTAAVRDWVRDEAADVLLVYGEYDPWTGGAIEVPVQPSSARFIVPAATHGAQIGALPEEERALAQAITTRFFGTEPVEAQRAAAARAGAAHQRILERRQLLELATPLRLRQRAR